MTAVFDTSTDPELAAHLLAGRRAALGVLISIAGPENYKGLVPERLYPGADNITVNGFDIGLGVDAAVIETIVRLRHPEAPEPRPRRPWWRIWR
jgi:hypothetical protein